MSPEPPDNEWSDRYEIRGELGRGGMGIVYLAWDDRLRRRVALKALSPDLGLADDDLARFEREAHTAATLNHPNIAAIYDYDRHDGRPFIVMELIPGIVLQARLRHGPMVPDEVVHLGQQVARALDAAHRAGFVHRDVKPGNIMVGNNGHATLLDFGLARIRPNEQYTTMIDGTQASVLAGTPGYMSPEQMNGAAVGPKTDIWALGCVLYECLTGAKAWDGELTPDVLKRGPDWSAMPEGVPVPLVHVIRRCLAYRPSRRPDADEVLDALGALTSLSSPTSPHPWRRSREPWILLGALAVITVALVLFGWPPPGRPVDAVIGEDERTVEVRFQDSDRRWTMHFDQPIVHAALSNSLAGLTGHHLVVVLSQADLAPSAVVVYRVGERAPVQTFPIRESGLPHDPEVPAENWVINAREGCVVDLTGDGRDEIVVSSSFHPWAPTVVQVIDPVRGRIGALVHNGHIAELVGVDLDGDGADEVVAATSHNPTSGVSLLVANRRDFWPLDAEGHGAIDADRHAGVDAGADAPGDAGVDGADWRLDRQSCFTHYVLPIPEGLEEVEGLNCLEPIHMRLRPRAGQAPVVELGVGASTENREWGDYLVYIDLENGEIDIVVNAVMRELARRWLKEGKTTIDFAADSVITAWRERAIACDHIVWGNACPPNTG